MRKYLSILLSIAGMAFAVYWVMISMRTPVPAGPLNEPAKNTFKKTIAGAGIIEAASRNISLAPPIPGTVDKIFVRENDLVKRGMPLYQIDSRDQRARLASSEAEIARARATLATAESEIGARHAVEEGSSATVEELKATLADAEQTVTANEQLYRAEVLPQRTYDSSVKTRDALRARLAAAEAQVVAARAQRLTAEARRNEAQAQLKVLEAHRTEIAVTLDRLVVTAPQDGRVLQINIKPGEFVSSSPQLSPILFGDTDLLQVRVDIDEYNASRVQAGSAAIAHLKGDADKKIALEFVRIDPYILPKKSLTGDNTERVDVRVLQIIYRFRPPEFPVYVGQQVDVFIDAAQH